MAKKINLDVIKRILSSFRTNWGLKLISLFFALILWIYIMAQANPVRTLTFSVPVTPPDITQLNNSGLTVSGNIAKYLKDVNVSVELNLADAVGFKSNEIQVTANLASITHEGNATVQLSASTHANVSKLTINSPTSVTLKIEKLARRKVPVDFTMTGTLPTGYWMDTPTLNPSMLDISGAATDVTKVSKASVNVDLTNLTAELSSAVDYTLLDSAGNILDTGGLTIEPPNCILYLLVLPTKTVPVRADQSLNGNVAKGYLETAVEVYPSEITIAGPKDVLDSIDALTPGMIDIDGKNANVSATRTLDLPKGVHAVAGATVQVLVRVGLKTTPVTLDNVPVTVTGLGAGLKATKTTATITVTCPELMASGVRLSKVHLFVDATGLDAGTHVLTIRPEFAPELGITDYVLKPSDILVTLTGS